jgi:hypothetical protein
MDSEPQRVSDDINDDNDTDTVKHSQSVKNNRSSSITC